jgi:osmotically-inducible protein OsmY
MKAKALAVLIPALFLATSAIAQTDKSKSTTGESPRVPTAEDRAHNREAVSDSALTGKVKSALAADVGLKTVKIDVDSAEGVVTLKGRVDSQDTKRRAEATAKKVSGVTEVRNQLDAKN